MLTPGLADGAGGSPHGCPRAGRHAPQPPSHHDVCNAYILHKGEQRTATGQTLFGVNPCDVAELWPRYFLIDFCSGTQKLASRLDTGLSEFYGQLYLLIAQIGIIKGTRNNSS